MAQRDKEEMELHVPETISLCTNNCGFPGNPTTNNMCQSCFKSLSAAAALSSRPRPCSPRSGPIRSPDSASNETKGIDEKSEAKKEAAVELPGRQVNRCFGCRKRVGLTGFRCRCGQLFCGQHRYSDRHDCGFDYKAAGQAAIALENPAVRAAKMVKI